MVKNLLLSFLCVLATMNLWAQTKYQYFDGNDTLPSNSILVIIDTTGGNVWQIGPPHKTIFDTAATVPNVIVTDTVNTYPLNDTSSFIIGLKPAYSWGILAVRWKQKLDFDRKHDGGIIEYSKDTGTTWYNVFHNPEVYNFYGYNAGNADTLVTGEYAFSGTDTNWRDIWLCFDYSVLSLTDSVLMRFTMVSDSVDSAKEGWMIDNMMMHTTMIHGLVKDAKVNEQIQVFPTITTGVINIEAPKVPKFHIIEQMQLVGVDGRVLEEYRNCPVKYYIDIGNKPNGLYYLKIRTNLFSGTFPVFLSK